MLDRAIDRVTSDPKKVHHPVCLRLMELGVKMLSKDSGEPVLHYTYPEVVFRNIRTPPNTVVKFLIQISDIGLWV